MATAWVCVHRVCQALADNASDFIIWPKRADARTEQRKWAQSCGIPGVVGAIKGCLIPISTPAVYQESYKCQNKKYAMSLQGVCNSENKFIDVDIGPPIGNVHDVFKNSDLKQMIENDKDEMFPDDGHMIGDSAYPCLDYLLVPFEDKGCLSEAQNIFNQQLSTSREEIDQTFRMLVTRFRRLNFILMKRTDLIPLLILAACILHNICIDNDDYIMPDDEVVIENNNNVNLNDNEKTNDSVSGIEKRNTIMLDVDNTQ